MNNEEWLLYLRKSRQDNPDETVEEVLQKHEIILQEWAVRELGHKIPEENIYREVVSGESIEERTEIKKVLARIEDPNVAGVLVIEPQRLSRGDLEDCGKLISAFRYTKTQIATPTMTYDLDNKMERKFFQDELLRGRDYLDYTKEILIRGRIAAVKRGCYIGRIAPYGYNKVKIGKDCTLEPGESADVVRLIFNLYVNEYKTFYQIACHLNDSGVPSPTGGKWVKDTIRHILRNVHYDGKVCFNRIKETTVIENGERVTKRLAQPKEDVIIAEGKHPSLVPHELFRAAQDRIMSNPSVKNFVELKNPYANLLFCAGCGHAMRLHPYAHAEHRYTCKKRPPCYKSAKQSEVEEAIITALEQSELPNLEAKLKSGSGKSMEIQKKMLERLEKQMEEYREQEETQFELLETRKYTQDLFDRRNAALRKKMDETQKRIYEAKSTMPKEINYAEKIVSLKTAISALRDPDMPANEKNRLLKAIVTRIEYSGMPPVDKSIKGFKKNENAFKLKITLRL